ncbi:MAG: PIG-L family deacetylase [Saprospiraceae bacterium]|nr:PIG-L family deacetylase [Saprospiraceae bacterium]
MRRSLQVLVLSCFTLLVYGQQPYKPTSADIFDAIQKSQVLGSVLYVAAHPDDENTKMISYFANARHYHTTYLSLTRGDGGQNLIGSEIGELLGLIRTQELLKARSTDGGNQLFTRANDFGYSKHPDETFDIWNKDAVFSDVIWAMRKTRPDIIVNRFDHRSPGTTHGHHTGSAILAFEAFSKVADPSVYPEQLKYVKTWQPVRQFFNTSWFFFGSQEAFEKADKSNMLSVDVGSFYASKGKSNGEIAAESRSFHKSQGFGSSGNRGSELEYIEFIQGDPVTTEDDPFKGINTTWSRVEGGEKIGVMLLKIEKNYQVGNPAASIPTLIEVYDALETLKDDGFWIPMKKKEISQIIEWCGGLFVEAVASNYSAAPGQQVNVTLEAVNRSSADIQLINYQMRPGGPISEVDTTLNFNQKINFEWPYAVPVDAPFSSAYWLRKEGTVGMYSVENQTLRGLPEAERPCQLGYTVRIHGKLFTYETPLIYKRTDPVDGEVYRPFEINPPVFLNFTDETLVFGAQAPKTVNITVKAGANQIDGRIKLQAPTGWEVSPEGIDVALAEQGQEQLVSFTVIPPSESGIQHIAAHFIDKKNPDQAFGYSAQVVDYDHIPMQTVLKDASVKAVKIDLVRADEKIGYVMGAGDKLPEFLQQIGYQVTLLSEGDLTGALSDYDAIVIGIRAYNTNDRLKFYSQNLFDYVEQGGNLIVQYNTRFRQNLDSKMFSPYPLNISRDRVTDENAEVRILAPEHPVIKGPNPITKHDFEGWVQERGLYFPDSWDEHFTAILSCNDPGEAPLDGSLLIAPYGKGWYVYTGLSWFRELPAGVPGAYRLFVNLLSLGKRAEP